MADGGSQSSPFLAHVADFWPKLEAGKGWPHGLGEEIIMSAAVYL